MSEIALVEPASRPPGSREYVPFPVLDSRNAWQARFEVPLILRFLGIPEGARILEVGCGSANALVALGERCAPKRLVGLDVDAGLLGAGRRELDAKGVAAELHHADVRDMPFEAGAFDVVIDFGTCYHIGEPDRALAEIARVLRPGGLFISETPLAQLLAHPLRSSGRGLPWSAASRLAPDGHALLFARWRRSA